MRLQRWRARVSTFTAVLVLAAGPAATTAVADDVSSAQSQVAAMQAKVEAVAATLTKGTREYEAGLRHLSDVQRKEQAARRESQRLTAAAAAQRGRLDDIASAAYRHPLPDLFSAAVTGGDLSAALVAKADLEHVSGSQQDVLREVVAARVRADRLTRTAEQLSAEARRTERRLARQLDRLRAIADRAERELQAAARELEKAQAAERARVAARRAAAARASRARGAMPLCQGGATVGAANGFVPEAALCPLWQAPGHKLRADAAASFNAMSRQHAAARGAPLCVTDSYRTYGEQVSVYRRKPGLAAMPGTSEHGWGLAVDFCGGVERFGSDAYRWMKANAGRYGFFHPAWAEPSGGKPEAWHWEYGG